MKVINQRDEIKRVIAESISRIHNADVVKALNELDPDTVSVEIVEQLTCSMYYSTKCIECGKYAEKLIMFEANFNSDCPYVVCPDCLNKAVKNLI